MTAGTIPEISGSMFGRYRLLRVLGEGGMATVYLAEQQGHGGFTKRVALKIVHPHLAVQGDFHTWFISEARLGGYLAHPNLVQTLDFGEFDGRLFLAMEFVDGITLSGLLLTLAQNHERMPLSVSLGLLVEICRGMEHAHRAVDHEDRPLRLVHRDLKPSNILLGRHGEVKIADFGVARAESNLNQTMAAGSIKGTVRYMSPEQAWGQLDLDHRSDLFALGSMLFELVTETPLYEGATPERLLRLAQDGQVEGRLQTLGPSPVREVLIEFLRRALTVDRDKRFQSAAEMESALLVIGTQLREGVALRSWLSSVGHAPNLSARGPALLPGTAGFAGPPAPGRSDSASKEDVASASDLSLQLEIDPTPALNGDPQPGRREALLEAPGATIAVPEQMIRRKPAWLEAVVDGYGAVGASAPSEAFTANVAPEPVGAAHSTRQDTSGGTPNATAPDPVQAAVAGPEASGAHAPSRGRVPAFLAAAALVMVAAVAWWVSATGGDGSSSAGLDPGPSVSANRPAAPERVAPNPGGAASAPSSSAPLSSAPLSSAPSSSAPSSSAPSSSATVTTPLSSGPSSSANGTATPSSGAPPSPADRSADRSATAAPMTAAHPATGATLQGEPGTGHSGAGATANVPVGRAGVGSQARGVMVPGGSPARPAAARLKPAGQGKGTLFGLSRPESVITLDGRLVKGFPVQDLPVSAGAHTISFKLGDQLQLSTRLEIAAGQTVRCFANFNVNTVECTPD